MAIPGPPEIGTGYSIHGYNVIDMAGQLEIKAGVPLAVPAGGDGAVFSAVLPAGRYATLVHVGHPSGLVDATARLLEWSAEQGLALDGSERDGPGTEPADWSSA